MCVTSHSGLYLTNAHSNLRADVHDVSSIGIDVKKISEDCPHFIVLVFIDISLVAYTGTAVMVATKAARMHK